MSYDWQPYNNNVQQNMQDGKFINASFALMAAGPPTFDALGAKPEANLESLPVVPIGLVQNLAVSHNRVFSRVFEVGSERSMFIPGRTVGQATLGRVLYDNWSLLRVLYAWYANQGGIDKFPDLISTDGNYQLQDAHTNTDHNLRIPPGHGDFFINLASDLFTLPLGLYFELRNSNEEPYGGFYMEKCHIPNHTLAMDSQGVIVQESVAVQFENMVPLPVAGNAVTSKADPGTFIAGTG